MLAKLLIANRGEIACRIIRTAKRLGVETVLAVSEADRRSLAAAQADAVVLIGPAPAAESYLSASRIIQAARAAGCDAIHPGYGFLSENADFAEAVAAAGLIFVGPTPSAMRALGGKAAAKTLAMSCGVPVVPGYHGDAQDLATQDLATQDLATLRREAKKIGYPVLIKAVNGGGGRGMRLVERDADFAEALDSAKREAIGAFGSDRVLLEKFIRAPRHIEIQVFGDCHGNVVHMFERDCSLQRRNQKVIEEAPAPGMTLALRAMMTDAAVRLAKAVNYQGAGTVEFLVEGGRLAADAPWYFIEMNTRLQVEHPVTEEITGLDLVEWQLRVASGEPLPLTQSAITMTGHAIEARLNAEDPANGFLPSVGRIEALTFPRSPDVRIETGVDAGHDISPFYDSMIAKLIARGAGRADALARLRRALAQTRLLGLKTNLAFLHALLQHAEVEAGTATTALIGRDLAGLTGTGAVSKAVAIGAWLLLTARSDSSRDPWAASDGFQLGGQRTLEIRVTADGTPRSVVASWDRTGLIVRVDDAACHAATRPYDAGMMAGDVAFVLHDMQHVAVAWPVYDAAGGDEAASADTIRAPINGRVAKVFVAPGAAVEKGARVAVIEAMKMEHVLVAPRAGTIASVAVGEGAQVAQGALIVTLE